MNLIPCTVKGAFMTITEYGAAPTVVLESGEGRFVPIYVGLWEAISIANAIRGEMTPRPITHDLVVDLFHKFSIILHELHIDALDDGVFYSTMVFLCDGMEKAIDCRPSDGIAIALRTKTPMFIDHTVLEKAAVGKDQLKDLRDISTFASG
jgi:bifunctional DNase/RNase